MPLLFEQLPTDITLEVVQLLELPDPLTLLLTCSSLYKLSNDRIFWISVLETTRKRYPIGCPVYADLSQYTLEALKGLVVSWMKLQHSWDQPSPKIVQPVTSTPLSGRARIIFNVQGTDILVLAMEGRVFCWDSKLATPFPFPPIEIGGHITGVSDPADAPGTCSFAILVDNHHILNLGSGNSSRYVIIIRHADGKATSFTSQFSEVSRVGDDRSFESLFLTEDMVGRTVVMGSEDDCIVTIGAVSGDNYLADSTSVLKLHRPVSNGDLFVSFAYQGHLFNLLENDFSVEIHHISRKSLQSGRFEESSLHSSEIFSSDPDGSTPFCYLTPSAPSYGIGAVFVRRTWWGEQDVMFTSFTFLPSTLTHVPDDGVSSPLAFDSPCVTTRIRGDLNHLGLVWLDHSGFNLVAVIQPDSEPTDIPRWLLLVRYHPDTRSISTHRLDVPDTIDLSSLGSLCVDDTAGAVHMVDNEGILSTLRYV